MRQIAEALMEIEFDKNKQHSLNVISVSAQIKVSSLRDLLDLAVI